MSITREDLANFAQFATMRIAEEGDKLTLEDLVAEWSANHEIEETIADIEQGRKDHAAGKGKPLENVVQELRDRLGIHQ